MIALLKKAIPHSLRQQVQAARGFSQWRKRDYAAPSPGAVKRRVLVRNGISDATWVETGTYLGDTSAFLGRRAKRVITIEPERTLYEKARERLRSMKNVEVVYGASEHVFPILLPKLSGNVNFWLDGHYSGGDTWITYKGTTDTPIVDELAQIELNLGRFARLCVLVDDIRSFESTRADSPYPRLDFLVDWARRSSLAWHIEHDIFVARNF